MNKRVCLRTVSVFSFFSALITVTLFVLEEMISHDKITDCLIGVSVCRNTGCATLVISVIATVMAVIKYKQYDEYQFEKAYKWRSICKTVSLVLVLAVCIIGLVINDISVLVYLVLLMIWCASLVEMLAEFILNLRP